MTENFFNNAPSNASFFESSPDPEGGKLDIIKSAEDQIRLLIKDSYENDALSNQIKFYAVCLRKLGNYDPNHEGLVRIKARIPELHYMLPIPKDKDDMAAIALYPTFVAYETSFSKVPAGGKANSVIPGTIVTVTFGNMSNFSEPLLLEIADVGTEDRKKRPKTSSSSTGSRGGLSTSKPSVPTEPPKDGGDGKVVFIFGDSNTNARANKAKIISWVNQFYPKSSRKDYFKDGRRLVGTVKRPASIQKGTSSSPPLNNLGVKKENIAAIIIGSAGGNDAGTSLKRITDDNSSLNKNVREVFQTLKDYQDSGILVLFIGLPYGMEDGNPRRAIKREAMDENFQKQAKAVGFTNYVSVMAETKKIKLAEKAAGNPMPPLFGVHYKRSPWREQYADLIESILPFK
jgi:lysophospholipase L1-like esterase